MNTVETVTGRSAAGWRDYYELTKPRVVALLLLTAVIGMFLAIDPQQTWFPDWRALIFGTSVLMPGLIG